MLNAILARLIPSLRSGFTDKMRGTQGKLQGHCLVLSLGFVSLLWIYTCTVAATIPKRAVVMHISSRTLLPLCLIA